MAAPAAASAQLLLRSSPAKRVDLLTAERPEGDVEKDEPWRVLIHNDDYTPMEYVTRILHDVFKLAWWRALLVMLRAHRSGIAEVAVLARHDAESHVRSAMERARGAGWPLRFSCEPVQ